VEPEAAAPAAVAKPADGASPMMDPRKAKSNLDRANQAAQQMEQAQKALQQQLDQTR